MNPRIRLIVFLVGAIGLIGLYLLAAFGLPSPDRWANRYRDAINARTVPERNATDAVSAVNFDYRGFDTLGEEFILFASVLGALVLLREAKARTEKPAPDAIDPHRDIPPTEAMRLWILALVGPKVLWGVYIVSHGQLTPGGGFQGGVILATVPLIIYLGESFTRFRKVVPHWLVHVAEAAGAGSYAVIGLVALFSARPFLTNVLPMGTLGEPTSSGTMPWISAAVGLEVAAGFSLLLYGFLQESLMPQRGQA